MSNAGQVFYFRVEDRTSLGTSWGRKEGFGSLCILSMSRSMGVREGTRVEKRVWTYCISWSCLTESGTPLNFMFLLDLSSRSAT